MTALNLFLPCAAGVESWLADEVHGLSGLTGDDLLCGRGGVWVRADWLLLLRLNLHSRLAQRVLVRLAHGPYASEDDLYALASGVAWEDWFGPRQRFRIDTTAQRCPLRSLNFATLRLKDAVADRFRQRLGERPSVDTHAPDVRLFAHLGEHEATLYIDTSGEPLFKRGWRQDKGDAPLKETLAAAMLAASGWWNPAQRTVQPLPLYDPCCGSGTIVIEAASIALGLAAGRQRRFAFERLRPHRPELWNAINKEASESAWTRARGENDSKNPVPPVFGSDVAHRMVDFAQRNAERAGVAHALQLRGGDALQRQPPSAVPGLILMNPPYGERIAAAGVAGVAGAARAGAPRGAAGRGREAFQRAADPRAAPAADEDARAGDAFFTRLAAHWKAHYGGWTAWLLSPDPRLPARLRLKESRRIPMWNGPIECRLLRFDLSARRPAADTAAPAAAPRADRHRDRDRENGAGETGRAPDTPPAA